MQQHHRFPLAAVPHAQRHLADIDAVQPEAIERAAPTHAIRDEPSCGRRQRRSRVPPRRNGQYMPDQDRRPTSPPRRSSQPSARVVLFTPPCPRHERALFVRGSGPTDLPSPRSPPTAPSCWAMTRSRRAQTAARIWDHAWSSEPSVQQANQLGMVFARLDCAPRWRQRLGELTLPTLVVHRRADRSSRSATARRWPAGSRRAAARPRRHGHRPAGRRGRRGHRRNARPLTPPPDRPAAVGALRLADLDVDNGRFRRWAMHPQPSDRPRRRGRP